MRSEPNDFFSYLLLETLDNGNSQNHHGNPQSYADGSQCNDRPAKSPFITTPEHSGTNKTRELEFLQIEI